MTAPSQAEAITFGMEKVPALTVVAWRTRYRSEPGMIGHYPWSYTERVRGMRLEHYEYEALVSLTDAQSALLAQAAEKDAWKARYDARELEAHQLSENIIALRRALDRIERWELPATGKFWDKEKTDPASYGAIYGSNGERDYIRAVARTAIDASRALAQQEAKS